MISDRAGSACLVNEENGVVFDINEPYIDFELLLDRINALTLPLKLRETKMPILYSQLMTELTNWIDEL